MDQVYNVNCGYGTETISSSGHVNKVKNVMRFLRYKLMCILSLPREKKVTNQSAKHYWLKEPTSL